MNTLPNKLKRIKKNVKDKIETKLYCTHKKELITTKNTINETKTNYVTENSN